MLRRGGAHIIKELRAGVTFNIMGIEITPSQLNIDPVLAASGSI